VKLEASSHLLCRGTPLRPPYNNSVTRWSWKLLRTSFVGVHPYDPLITIQLPGEAGSFIVHKAGLAGWTFYAVRSNEVSIVAELLRYGADIHVKDSTGISAYDITVKKGYTEIMNLMKTTQQ